MPNSENPTLESWLPYLQKLVNDPDENTYFIGHSLGCITILRYLETLSENQNIGAAILIAGFGEDLEYKGYNGELKSFFKIPIDWEKIKKRCKKFIAIHSKDDPWVSIQNNDLFKEKLGAESIILDNMKHFSGDDGITELPIVLEKILEISQ